MDLEMSADIEVRHFNSGPVNDGSCDTREVGGMSAVNIGMCIAALMV